MKPVEWDEDTTVISARVHVRKKEGGVCTLCDQPIEVGSEYVEMIAVQPNQEMQRSTEHLRHWDDADLAWQLSR